jgi:hypothetical protein
MCTFTQSLIALTVLLNSSIAIAGGVYQEPDAFIRESFADRTPEVKVFWPDESLRKTMEKILGHTYQGMRIRYWIDAKRSAWILDEIGKDKPITTGIVINNGRIEKIRVLTFRESRGWEVRHSFFTEQFDNAGLQDDMQLDTHIDNISGATLSVNALTKVARLALLLHREVTHVDPK